MSVPPIESHRPRIVDGQAIAVMAKELPPGGDGVSPVSRGSRPDSRLWR